MEKSQKAKKPTKNIGLMALIFIVLHLIFYIFWYHLMSGYGIRGLDDWRFWTGPFRYAFESQDGYRIKTNLGIYALINPMPILGLIAGIYVLHKTVSNKVHKYFFWLNIFLAWLAFGMTCFHKVWKFQDISVIQSLCEINFKESRSSKTAVFAILGAVKFVGWPVG